MYYILHRFFLCPKSLKFHQIDAFFITTNKSKQNLEHSPNYLWNQIKMTIFDSKKICCEFFQILEHYAPPPQSIVVSHYCVSHDLIWSHWPSCWRHACVWQALAWRLIRLCLAEVCVKTCFWDYEDIAFVATHKFRRASSCRRLLKSANFFRTKYCHLNLISRIIRWVFKVLFWLICCDKKMRQIGEILKI